MPRFSATVTSAAALANGSAILSIVPAAAVNFKLLGVKLGVVNSVGTLTDADLAVGLNRATARGTSSGTATVAKADPNSAASAITGVDNAWSVQPTLAASDDRTFPFNTRGGYAENFNETDIVSTVGTANPIVLVQRSGGALPASHSIVATVNWFE